ncbi:copper resistance protein CopZ [Pseudomonas amygdali pv. tabaci str. ATCC 11528]|jgi:copper chaperone|uniref:Copper resistance protein CopZ n=5 Tax=Pseudomonas syringae group TaxID=136849 RepID=Q9KWM7_PSESX|nr:MULTISPECIES: heavy-metal-associated domain-containing protein [Pseudomonas]OZI86691.1 copper chaperone [Pseudomonas avellanae]RMV80989.1 ORFH protein [Pseudomonas amygdali pv. tabaci]APP99913.1 copper resistance protein CopZ [Pseudomonas syringae pv. actinidiae]AQX41928.1 heavy metal detoxification protein CopZ [Pseudomonas syringae pv. syringae]AQX41994.1 heavy metal detoxification protein CopZ [Pseudomonas syringae pv. syringae]
MYQFNVQGMNCGHCVKSITAAVTALDSEATVDVDLESRTVQVQSRQPAQALLEAIQEKGYPAELA